MNETIIAQKVAFGVVIRTYQACAMLKNHSRTLLCSFFALGFIGLFAPAYAADQDCPLTRKVRFADMAVQFKPGVPASLDSIQYGAKIGEVFGACTLKNGILDVKLDIRFTVERGAKAEKYVFPIPYFIVVYRTGDQAIQKLPKTVEANFGRNTMGTFNAEISEKIKVAASDNLQNLEIFIGFQLTPEQLEYNKSQGRRAN